MVKIILMETVAENSHPIQPEPNNELKHKLTISDSLFLETFLMKIRGKSISFASHLKKSIVKKVKELESKILEAEDHIRLNFQNISEASLAN